MSMLMFILQVFLAFFIASMVVSMFKNKKQKGQQMADLQEKLAAYEKGGTASMISPLFAGYAKRGVF